MYDRSIAIDASTVDGITVTVAVRADRAEELEILDSIYTATEGHDFFPFRDKSNGIAYEGNVGIYEAVIAKNISRLTATAHLGRDGSDSERVEAVQSAVLVRELEVAGELVILDGNEDKATRFGRAISGVAETYPPTATCVQAELYYPTALLADLCASHLANQIDPPRDCTELTPAAPITKKAFDHLWGPAYYALVTSSDIGFTEPVERRRAETVRARMNCWFEGQMGGGEPVRTSPSVQPIVQFARKRGYEELATRLSAV